MGVRLLDGPGHTLEAPDGLKARVVLPRRSVGHRHRDGAAGRGRRAGADARSVTPPASRTSWSCASFFAAWARASRGGRPDDSRLKAPAKLRGATKTLWGDYIEAGSWACRRGHHRRQHGDRRHAMGGHGGGLLRAQEDERALRARRRDLSRRAAHADQRRTHHDRPVAWLPERSREPGHGARDASRRARRSCTTGCTNCASIRWSR